VVDAEGKALEAALPCRPFLVKPNLQELEAFFGKTMDSEEDIQIAAQKIQKLGAENVLVSMGAQGALLLNAQGRVFRMTCPQGVPVNSIGAGDSMVAGFLAGLTQSGDEGYALKLGIAAGSATTFSRGLASREAIRECMEKICRGN
jgi:1-phosphofructokinase